MQLPISPNLKRHPSELGQGPRQPRPPGPPPSPRQLTTLVHTEQSLTPADGQVLGTQLPTVVLPMPFVIETTRRLSNSDLSSIEHGQEQELMKPAPTDQAALKPVRPKSIPINKDEKSPQKLSKEKAPIPISPQKKLKKISLDTLYRALHREGVYKGESDTFGAARDAEYSRAAGVAGFAGISTLGTSVYALKHHRHSQGNKKEGGIADVVAPILFAPPDQKVFLFSKDRFRVEETAERKIKVSDTKKGKYFELDKTLDELKDQFKEDILKSEAKSKPNKKVASLHTQLLANDLLKNHPDISTYFELMTSDLDTPFNSSLETQIKKDIPRDRNQCYVQIHEQGKQEAEPKLWLELFDKNTLGAKETHSVNNIARLVMDQRLISYFTGPIGNALRLTERYGTVESTEQDKKNFNKCLFIFPADFATSRRIIVKGKIVIGRETVDFQGECTFESAFFANATNRDPIHGSTFGLESIRLISVTASHTVDELRKNLRQT